MSFLHLGLLLGIAAQTHEEPASGESRVATVRRDDSGAAVAGRLYDLSRDRVLYCVGYAHLDTQWRWDFCKTIDQYIKDTLEQNFALFDKHPGYVFNFTGSVRYEMMKEYYPEHYERLKKEIAAGRWFVSGSSVDEGDVNVPSAEAIIRQVLYGNEYFRREFGRESMDFMLPDCFGFPASMPSIWAHCGLIGFSTQKLTWGSAVGIPFKIGQWVGPDGRSVIAALDPGPYVGAIKGRVDTNEQWVRRVDENGRRYGVFADYHYYGVGDMGGAPKPEDVANYVQCAADSAKHRLRGAPDEGGDAAAPDSGEVGGPNDDAARVRQVIVALVSSDQMYKDITSEQKARLPKYQGDMLLTEHSAGTLTSQCYMKRWNRMNEQLADAAERAAVFADWLGGASYPHDKLYASWVRTLANQMHDILPGTSLPRAYTFSWNDEIVAANGFAEVLTDSIGAVARGLDTRAEGVPLVVYNALAIEREDLVEADLPFDRGAPSAVRVFDGAGAETPSQVLSRTDRVIRVLFAAKVPPVGLAVYDVRPAERPYEGESALRASAREMENEHYVIKIDETGDVTGIRDKQADRELLKSAHQLVFTYERPANWPAWNMDWADRQKPPLGALGGPARVRVIERGPVRVAVEIEREGRGSIVRQEIRLARGDAGRRVEFYNEIDWQSVECALRASFPLTVSNPKATYNWEMGTIERGNNEPTKYEVPSHQWFDVTDESGDYGVSILEDCKYGSDKPADNVVRLTLLYTPGVRSGYLDQHSQDWGRHEMVYALHGHAGDWRAGRTEWQARRLNQPLVAFRTQAHDGALGRRTSMLDVTTPQVDIRAIKNAEQGDWTIVRVQELWGRPANDVRVRFAAPPVEAFEVDGQERRIGEAALRGAELSFDVTPYSPRSFAVRLGKPPVQLKPPRCTPVELPFDCDVVSGDADRTDGGLDGEGRTIPAEMLPRTIVSEGVRFELGTGERKAKQAVACRGQRLALPEGDFDHVYLLAAAEEDTRGTFLVGDESAVELGVQCWTGFIGQWDDRLWDREFPEVDFQGEGKVTGITTGFIKRDPIAWFCTHRHHPKKGNEAYRFSYLYKYSLVLPAGAKQLTLPDNPRIKVLAATAAKNPNDSVVPARPLYDDFTGRRPIRLRYKYPEPPPPVFARVKPVGIVEIDRKDSFGALTMGEPVADDYADQSRDHGVVFRCFEGGGKYRPHSRSGVVDGTLPRLNDGAMAQNHDDTRNCVWYDGEGRFTCDLGRAVRIERINTYSWHRSNRAPQFFSLWGSNDETMPPADISADRHEGWKLLAVVKTKDLGNGGIHGSSVKAADGALGPYRWLLWIAENVGEGTFFTEIDVHEARAPGGT